MQTIGMLDHTSPAEGEDDPLGTWLDRPATVVEQLRAEPGRVAAELSRSAAAASAYPIMRIERLAAAVLDRRGRLLFADAAFERRFGQAAIDPDTARRAAAARRPEASPTEARDGSASLLIYGDRDLARHWLLPPEAAQAAARPEARVVALGPATNETTSALTDAGAAFGLTPLQTRVAVAVVATGSIRLAAERTEIAYATAREVMAAAMKRVGVTRVSGLVQRLTTLSFGVWPLDGAPADVLCDIWGLSPRQLTLASGVAQGLSRQAAAAAADLSEAAAKKELDKVYLALGVASASGLARVLTEARALALVTQATGGVMRRDHDPAEPLGFALRPDGTRVAFSDYGPRPGRPVLVLHSSSTSRSVPGVLVRALQRRGFRPLAIDRPGFGLSDPYRLAADDRRDVFAAACDDVALVCQRLKLPRVDLLARGAAQVALGLARQRPDLLDRVALLNPDPHTEAGGPGQGAFMPVKAAFVRHPALIEPFARILASQMTPVRMRRLVFRAIATSQVDVAAMSNPQNYADYARGIRLFATGRIGGYVAEQQAMARAVAPEPLAGCDDWRVLIGAQDPMHDFAQVERYWRRVLPGARFEVMPDAGRFLYLSHPEAAAAILL
ncbi:MAG: alpha/beta hydrolase fold protein [Caulobacter sp.]|nr:alpha/beta hydrolase fold protein [Caulobacter sp.]